MDYEAPIITNNDGNKNAVAYVRSSTPVSTRPAIAGAELISHYESTTSIPNVATAVLILRFDAPTRKLEVHVSTGRNKETMAFNPQSVGVDIVEFEHALRNSGAIIVGVTYLSHLFGDDEFSLGALRALADMQSDEFLHFSVNPPTKLYFSLSDSSLEGLGDTALLLLTPNPSSSLIAAKRLYSSHLTR